jgi:hypothetical protein
MKCLGSGYLYLYNAAFPAALLWGHAINVKSMDLFVPICFFVILAFSLISIGVFYRRLGVSKTQKVDHQFEKLLNHLKSAPKGAVMCFPQQWYDIIAYKTGQPVLYGGHGFGLKLLEPVFPRLLLPMREIIKRYNVRYLIIMEGYIPTSFLSDFSYRSVLDFGQYRFYDLANI